jgi:hypothetical protein
MRQLNSESSKIKHSFGAAITVDQEFLGQSSTFPRSGMVVPFQPKTPQIGETSFAPELQRLARLAEEAAQRFGFVRGAVVCRTLKLLMVENPWSWGVVIQTSPVPQLVNNNPILHRIQPVGVAWFNRQAGERPLQWCDYAELSLISKCPSHEEFQRIRGVV